MPTIKFRKEDYVECASVPEGLKWKPMVGRPHGPVVRMLSIGNLYKSVRDLKTGAVTYYKHKSVDGDKEKSPAVKIDAEPEWKSSTHYLPGARAWFIDTGARWFLVEVVKRTDARRIVIKSVTGWDADKQTPWGYGEELEFPARQNNPLYQRLRKLSARYV
jgi:hypothetical protein